MADLYVEREGSLFLVHPMSETGEGWLLDHFADDAVRCGAAIVVEHRYIVGIVQGAINDGLEVT